MRLSETRPVVAKPASAPRHSADEPAAAAASESRALVAITPVVAGQHDAANRYRPAEFLAHLIAMKEQHPQTRERRRVAPREAIAAYRAVEATTRR
jgi:hypothetical protein